MIFKILHMLETFVNQNELTKVFSKPAHANGKH